MNLFREWASKVNTRKGRMVPITAIPTLEKSYDSGYMSVYMFSESDAKEIIASGQSRGFNKYDVYSNEIMIDLDTGRDALTKCQSILDSEKLGYTIFTSGGKGYHVVIPLDKLYSGKNVPYSQKQWIEQRKIECDLSLYQAGRLISMVGRIHPITRVRKTRIHNKDGQSATLSLINAPTPLFNYQVGTSNESLQLGLAQLSLLSSNEPTEGNRHSNLWKCAKSLSEGGVSFDVALELLTLVNNSFSHPKDASEVERAVRQAYGEEVQLSI